MIRIFIAYSSKDLVFKNEIRKRLGPLKRAGKVEIWDNYDIEAGKDWDAEVREQLAQSDLILLLLSPDSFDSDYFYEVEAPIALVRHEAGEAIAVGILLRPCDLKYTPFGDMTRYELLPKKGLPIVHPHWHHVDDAYLTIFQEVDVLVEKIEEKRKGASSISENWIGKNIVEQSQALPKNGDVIRDIPEGPEMVFVEGGTFRMGGNELDSSKPIHSVIVPSFLMGKYSVTFEEYDIFCAEMGKKKPSDNKWGRGRKPVFNVNWHDAQEYCLWLSHKTGNYYRLPSEAEWEFAARGGTLSKGFKYAGSNNMREVGWCDPMTFQTKIVGEKIANELGFYDMSGNVWEWCRDIWHKNYLGAPTDGSAWLEGGDSAQAVARGGSQYNAPFHCQVEYRDCHDLNKWGGNNFGFRVARDV